jgi:hypothetical protein
MVVLGLSYAATITIALIFIFFVLLPGIIAGLGAVIYFGILGERDANHRFERRRR